MTSWYWREHLEHSSLQYEVDNLCITHFTRFECPGLDGRIVVPTDYIVAAKLFRIEL